MLFQKTSFTTTSNKLLKSLTACTNINFSTQCFRRFSLNHFLRCSVTLLLNFHIPVFRLFKLKRQNRNELSSSSVNNGVYGSNGNWRSRCYFHYINRCFFCENSIDYLVFPLYDESNYIFSRSYMALQRTGRFS